MGEVQRTRTTTIHQTMVRQIKRERKTVKRIFCFNTNVMKHVFFFFDSRLNKLTEFNFISFSFVLFIFFRLFIKRKYNYSSKKELNSLSKSN